MREERGGVFAAAFVMRTHDGLADGLSDAQRSIQGRIAAISPKKERTL